MAHPHGERPRLSRYLSNNEYPEYNVTEQGQLPTGMADHHSKLLEVAGVVHDHAEIWSHLGAKIKTANFDTMVDLAALILGTVGVEDVLATFAMLDQETGELVLLQLRQERLMEDSLDELLERCGGSHSNETELDNHGAGYEYVFKK